MTGGVVFTKVTVWVQVEVLVQKSVASQVRVMLPGQTPLVKVLTTVTITFEPLQASNAVGASKFQVELHGTVLLVGQLNAGGLVLTTVTVWLQAAVLPQRSVASQVWMMICGQEA